MGVRSIGYGYVDALVVMEEGESIPMNMQFALLGVNEVINENAAYLERAGES